MADDGYLDNKKIVISSETVLQILTKFCKMAHISPPELPANQKLKLLKIQDGGRPPF